MAVQIPAQGSTSPTPVTKRRFFERYIDAAEHTGNKLWDAANHVTGGFIAFLAQAFKNFFMKGTTEAVVFGYWAMFSLFPLVMLAVVVASFALGEQTAREQVYRILNDFIPGGGTELIRENINQAIGQRSSFGAIGLISLAYGAVGLFTNLQANLSRIFRDARPRSWPEQIIIGLMMIIMLTVLILASFIISLLFTGLGGRLFGRESALLQLGAPLLPLFLNTVMFYLLFRYIPRRNISWRALIPASVFAAIGWELSKNFFGWYAANLANYGFVYGSLGTVIALLTWTYLTGCFISLCGEIAVATDDWLSKRPPAVTVVEPCVNKPVDEVPSNAEGQVVKVEKPV